MNEVDLNKLRKLLNEPAIHNMLQKEIALDRQVKARNMRNEVHADWLENFFQRMHGSYEAQGSHRINSETGRPHTVESMTAEYSKKIGLDKLISQSSHDAGAMQKAASLDVPLSKKQANDFLKKKELTDEERAALWEDIKHHIYSHLSSHRGYADAPAIVYELREVFSEDIINEFSDELMDEIEKQKQHYDVGNIRNRLPSAPMSNPQKVDFGLRDDDQLFRGMQNTGVR